MAFEATYTAEESEAMALGLVPQEMEDKWFIYAKGDHLYFHRSWTGACIYGLRFEETSEGYRVAESWVNRDREQYSQTDTAYDRALLAFLIDSRLLGKSASFPLPAEHATDDRGVYQHHLVGSAYPEQPNPYASPNEGEPLPGEPVFPQITPRRLAIGLVLITVGWLGILAKAHADMIFGSLIAVLSGVALAWVIDPDARRREVHYKGGDVAWIMILATGGMTFLISFKGTKSFLWLSALIVHPAALFIGWLASCGALLFAWRKRRNNPPYQPQMPEKSRFSPAAWSPFGAEATQDMTMKIPKND